MQRISLRKASNNDKASAIGFDYNHNKVQHIEQKRAEKITKAILRNECFIISADGQEVGFVLFDYRFFDQGWIELIIIDEKYRGKGIGTQTLNLLSQLCKTEKIFTSTNTSNTRMQRTLDKAGFSFAGKIDGLDDGDPELFYYKRSASSGRL